MAEKAAAIPLAQTRQSRQTAPVRWGDINSFILLTIGAIVMILPLVWMFSTSLRLASDSFKLPPVWIPTEFRIENYLAVFKSAVPFGSLFLNSVKITLAVTVGQLITCSMAGFAFARLRFPGRNALFILL